MNVDRNAIAEAWDELKDSGHEFDELVEVKARISKNPRAVVSIRVGEDELDEIERAAANGNVSEFIRTAAVEKARLLNEGAGPGDGGSAAVQLLQKRLARAQALVDELAGELNGQPTPGPQRRARPAKSA